MRVRIARILKEHSRVQFVTVLEGKVRVFVPSAVMAFSKGCPLLPVACDCGIHYDKQVGTNLIKFWPWLCVFWSKMLYNDSISLTDFIVVVVDNGQKVGYVLVHVFVSVCLVALVFSFIIIQMSVSI